MFPINDMLPFTSERRKMSVVINYEQKKRMLIKGSTDVILKYCTKYIDDKDGKIKHLNQLMIYNID